MSSYIKYSNIIFVLPKYYLSIYKHIQATNWIKKRIISSIVIQGTDTNVFFKIVTNSSQAFPPLSNFFPCFSYSLQEIMTPKLQNLNKKISRLIKEGRYFNCKRKGYTMLNYPKKARGFEISNILNIDDIEETNKEKK